jgi:hypothetical protein
MWTCSVATMLPTRAIAHRRGLTYLTNGHYADHYIVTAHLPNMSDTQVARYSPGCHAPPPLDSNLPDYHRAWQRCWLFRPLSLSHIVMANLPWRAPSITGDPKDFDPPSLSVLTDYSIWLGSRRRYFPFSPVVVFPSLAIPRPWRWPLWRSFTRP